MSRSSLPGTARISSCALRRMLCEVRQEMSGGMSRTGARLRPRSEHTHNGAVRVRRTVLCRPGSLGQGHDDSLRPAHVRHAPDVLVLTDATDQAVTVRSQPVDNRLEVVHFEANVAQPQLI